MLFSSLEFLCFFFPLFFLTYYLAGALFKRNIWGQNAVLLIFSLIFYAWGELSYFWLLITSIVINYLFALLIGWFKGGAHSAGSHIGAKLVVAGDIIVNLALLGVFKYAGLAVTSINAVLHTDLPVPEIALPIGISFFTFQIMSYVIDVYKGKVAAQKNIFTVAVYLCAFPQLIAGPIVRYSDIEEQLAGRTQTTDGIYRGLQRFIIGLSKKVIIANTCAALCDNLFASEFSAFGAAGAWIGMLAYTLQIYYDFSGYSDMAIGMGYMMGFEYKENFDYPYASKSVTDFWRRWHISLSSFFREYVYIPMGGNRVSKPRWLFNIMTVWMLTGLWHGASWNFVLWGLYYGILLVLEKTIYGKYLEQVPVLNRVYTILAFVCGWVFFRFESIGEIGQMFTAMAGGYGLLGEGGNAFSLLGKSGLDVVSVAVFLAGILFSFPVLKKLGQRDGRWIGMAKSACSIALLVLCIILMETGAYNPFIYFRF